LGLPRPPVRRNPFCPFPIATITIESACVPGSRPEPKQSKSVRLTHCLRRIWTLTRIASFALGLLVVVVMFTPLVPWWAHQLSGPFDNKRGDSLIVLASADSGDGILSYSSYLRCEYAIRAWREGWPKVILISGSSPTGEPISEAMADFIESQGVPAAIVQVETLSTSTRENAIDARAFTANLPGTKVLLTSDYHMYRAQKAFEKAGIQVVSRPFPDAYKRSASLLGRWPAFLDLCEESTKIGYYKMRGWI
jgi:uncharacterized SAM-binding protein YcdF (DUF218 family)